MEPTLADGERVLLRRPRRLPRPGEIILARTLSGLPVLHRVLQVSPIAIVTQGDNRPGPDPAWEPHQVRAIAHAREAAGGRWIRLGAVTTGRPSRLAAALPMGTARRIALGAVRALACLLDGETGPPPNPPRRPPPTTPRKDYPMSERFDTQTVGKELAVHDRQTGAVHFLNQTAAFVWESRCAGASTAAIVAALKARHPHVTEMQLTNDVETATGELIRLGLLPS